MSDTTTAQACRGRFAQSLARGLAGLAAVAALSQAALSGDLEYAKAIEASCARVIDPVRPEFYSRTEVLCFAARDDCSQWSGAQATAGADDRRCAIKVYRREGRIVAARRWYLGGGVLQTDRFCYRPDTTLAAEKTTSTVNQRVRINIRSHFAADGSELSRSEHHFEADTGEALKRKTYETLPDLPRAKTSREVWRAMLAALVRAQEDEARAPMLAGALPSQLARRYVEERARRVLDLLKSRNFEELAGLVHPVHGVRFSPEARVDPDRDRLLRPRQVALLGTARAGEVWTPADAAEDVVVETDFESYYRRFIYNHDFANAPRFGYNCAVAHSKTINNARAVYPDAVIAEFNFPGLDTRSWGYDWSSLRLAFSRHHGTWYLVGIIHDHWTL